MSADVMNALLLAGKGMLGIFVVMILISLLVRLFIYNRIRKEKGGLYHRWDKSVSARVGYGTAGHRRQYRRQYASARTKMY